MPLLARAGRSRYKRTARGLFELQVQPSLALGQAQPYMPHCGKPARQLQQAGRKISRETSCHAGIDAYTTQ